MTQVNVNGGPRQPIQRLQSPVKVSQSVDGNTNSVVEHQVPFWYCPLSEEQAVVIVTHCTRLLSIPLEPNSLHSNMRLLLSLTRDPHLASVFMCERGPHALLSITHESCFNGFSSLSSLLFRHVLEDNDLLAYCMDSIMREVIVGDLENDRVASNRDFDYVLHRLAPCVSRSKVVFMKTTAERMELINEPQSLTGDEVELHVGVHVCPVRVKYKPLKNRESFVLTSIQTDLLKILVDHLFKHGLTEDVLSTIQIAMATNESQNEWMRHDESAGEDDDCSDETLSEDMTLEAHPFFNGLIRLLGQKEVYGMMGLSLGTDMHAQVGKKKADSREPKDAAQPIISQSSILRLLAEIIALYPVCAGAILNKSNREMTVQNSTRVMSVLTLILDYLLPASYISNSSSTQVTVFVQTLANAALTDDVLISFITEIKASFSRALSLPESLIKHQRIRAIINLLEQILEPPQTQTSSNHPSVNPTRFVRMLIRHGFITDLCEAIHNLDLSSSNLNTTINAILKILEYLTKVTTQFLAMQKIHVCQATMATKDISGHDSHQHAYLSIDDLGLGVTIIDKEGVKEDYKMDQNVMVNNLKHSDKARDINEMHYNSYCGEQSKLIQQFLTDICPNPFVVNNSRTDTTESVTIPTNISRWREESIALDGATMAFLHAANLRSPLLAALSNNLDQVVQKQQLNEEMCTTSTAHPSCSSLLETHSQCSSFSMEDSNSKANATQTEIEESRLLSIRFTGKAIVDQEGLTCLLALLFVDLQKIDFSRLLRIFRSLSQHVLSCSWIITSLLSILKKTGTCNSPVIPNQTPSCSAAKNQSHWLNMTIRDEVNDSRVPVFRFPSLSGNNPSFHASDVTIHPLAVERMMNNVMELLIFLAIQFPTAFLPLVLAPKEEQLHNVFNHPSGQVSSDFWQTLLHLDLSSNKGKSTVKNLPNTNPPPSMGPQSASDIFSQSPLGELMRFLDNSIVQGSGNLTDKVLRVLYIISQAIPKQGLVSVTNGDRKEVNETINNLGIEQTDIKGLETLLDPSSAGLDISTATLGSSVISVGLLNSVIGLLKSSKCTQVHVKNVGCLLINLSQCSPGTRETISVVLLNAVKEISRILIQQISVLLHDLQNRMSPSVTCTSSSEKYTLATVSAALSEGVDLLKVQTQGPETDSPPTSLSSMEPFVCEDSQQSFFLRLITVARQLHTSSCLISSCHGESSSSPTTATVNNKQTTPTNHIPSQYTHGRPLSTIIRESDDTALTPLRVLLDLNELWTILGDCLDVLSNTHNPNDGVALQPCLESFFLVHDDHYREMQYSHKSGIPHNQIHTPRTDSNSESCDESSILLDTLDVPKEGVSDSSANLLPSTAPFLQFAERHRTTLNQTLRQSPVPLPESSFAVLVNHAHLLDFDIKRRYLRHELHKFNKDSRLDNVYIDVRREHVFEDSFKEFNSISSIELTEKNLYIIFDGQDNEEGEGLASEWYPIIAKEMLNPDNALFKATGDKGPYMPDPVSCVKPDHLKYFKFIGRVVAKAISDSQPLDCHFTRSFCKHILGRPVHYTDVESVDGAFYKRMMILLNNDLNEIGGADLTFSTEINEFGETVLKDLKPNGREIPVTESNKEEYIQLMCQMKMTGSIGQQIGSFLSGFYEVIPKSLISIFNEQELELLIADLPNLDIIDLKANTEYHNYTETSLQIQWFWEALSSYNQTHWTWFLYFATLYSKVPLQGFVALKGLHGLQKFQIHRDDGLFNRLPTAHSSFNQLNLPPYETYEELKQKLFTAVEECHKGLDFEFML